MPRGNWEGLNNSLGSLARYLIEKKQGEQQLLLQQKSQEQQFQQALQKIMFEAQMKAQIEQQDPYKQAMSALLNRMLGGMGQGQGGGMRQSPTMSGLQSTPPMANGMEAMPPAQDQGQFGDLGDVAPELTLGPSGPSISFKPSPAAQMRQKELENKQEVEKQTATAVAKEKQVNASKLNRLNSILNTIEKEWVKTTPPGSRSQALPFVGRGLAGLSAIGSRFQSTQGQRADASYIAFLNGIRAQLARSMGDVGNLSEYEQKAVLSLLPTITDTKEVGLDKLAKVRQLISNILESKGVNMSMNNQNQQPAQQRNRIGKYNFTIE